MVYNINIKSEEAGHIYEPPEKLMILGAAARYDASCASSGSGRQGKRGGLGNAHMAEFAIPGQKTEMRFFLKILYSNECVFDCAYCANRRSADIKRATFEPEEVAELTTEFYRRNYIEGLF